MPRFTIGGKQSGQTLKLDASGRAELEVGLSWTFPMAFAELIMGDGKQVHRKRIDLTGTGAFEKQTLKTTLNLIGKSWVRFCLLYTSPSPRDATLSRMPSSA